MDSKNFAQAALAAFVFVFAFEFVVHSVLLKGMYVETAHLWRSEADSKMQFIMLGQVVFSAVTAFLFTKICDTDFFKNNGLRYGLVLGLILASPTIAFYSYMPVPFTLWISWVGAETVKGLGAGIAIAFFYTTGRGAGTA